MNWLYIIVLSLIGGALYRMGGQGYPFNKQYRSVGVPLCALLLLFLLGNRDPWWAWLTTAMLLYGTMTTYFKWGGQKQMYWWNWTITGFMYGIAMFPFCFASMGWDMLIARACWLAGAVGIVTVENLLDVKWEEGLRGFFLVATIPFLLI